ncbi:phage scaffolding protein [uncultured Granulicatella sp.]|uniref:phage scaffolding protein n=1 Tax=uncultured Granulicatella sp. TaxID=316089 RepID=UPI00261C0625|nr:phage scaffolding protein [uncultured Granulicatella sp.]
MEWIIDILKKYQKEDGTIDLATAEQEIKSEFPKQAVPKTVFNEKSEQLKTANATIDELRNGDKNSQGNEELQTQLEKYKNRIAELEAQEKTNAMNYQARSALEKAGISDVEYGLYLLGTLEADEQGNVKDLDNKINDLRTSKPVFFKDESQPSPNGYKVEDTKLDDSKEPVSEFDKAYAEAAKAFGLDGTKQ